MSSGAYIELEEGTIGVPVSEWQAFCAEHGIEHRPNVSGGNMFYLGQVEIAWDWLHSKNIGKSAHSLSFSTYWMGVDVPRVAQLALLAWQKWGGTLNACPEVRRNLCVPAGTVTPTTDLERKVASQRSTTMLATDDSVHHGDRNTAVLLSQMEFDGRMHHYHSNAWQRKDR